MITLDKNLWLLTYPLNLLGVNLRRNVTLIRLSSGKIVIHSTGPFPGEDVATILALGPVGWICEAMLRHDTFSKAGRTAFLDVPFLAPEGFGNNQDFVTHAIIPPPKEWSEELNAIELQGIPSMRETVFFHKPSRTLIVADLIFNFPYNEPLWSELMLKAAVGSQHYPGLSRAFKLSIKDEAAFQESISQMMTWDFDRVIVGHGDVIERDGKERVASVLSKAGLYQPTLLRR